MKTKIKNFLAAIREERGATDPILVLATIAVSLILLVGGTFAVTGIITNGKDLNAKGDLDKVSIAETAYYAENDAFAAYLKNDKTAGSPTIASKLENSGLGFNPTDGTDKLLVEVTAPTTSAPGKWKAASESASGKVFVKTSESNRIVTVIGFKTAPTAKDATDLGFADVAALTTFANKAKA
jgi:hypothetical protein